MPAERKNAFNYRDYSMSTLRITNGRVIDPSRDIDEVTDVWLARGRVMSVGGEGHDEPDLVIDAAGLIVCPGLIDVHVHLREPGNEEDETIDSGASAALTGNPASHFGQCATTRITRGLWWKAARTWQAPRPRSR